VAAAIEREVIQELERVVSRSVRAVTIAERGESSDGEVRRTPQSRCAGEGESAQAKLFHDVSIRDGVFGGLVFGEAQVPESEFVDRRSTEDARVGESARHLARVIERAIAGERIGREGI